MRADQITIKTAKTGKVTALVMVMSLFSRKKFKLQSANLGNERPSCQKAERANILEGNTRGLRSLSQNQENSRYRRN
jgi:hypothetical protein